MAVTGWLGSVVAGALVLAGQPWSDGPHVLWEGGRAVVVEARAGQRHISRLPATRKLPLPGLPPLQLDPRGPRTEPVEQAEPARIAAVSDIHGNLDGLKALLAAQGVVDGRHRWTYGQGHLVVVGDVVDRGAQVTEALWYLRALEVQARAAGGRLHLLLGNHELMNLRGDLRYLNAKYAALAEGPLVRPWPRLLAGDTELGRWIRSRRVVLRLGRFLFVHGGISPALLERVKGLRDLDAAFRQDMDQPGRPFGLSGDGPVWYRGLLPGADRKGDAPGAHVAEVLRRFHVSHVVVGHTTLPVIVRAHGGQVFGIDAGLKDGKPGELWLWEGGRLFRGLADGTRKPLD